MTPVETNSRPKPKLTHGGARPGAGRKKGIPNRWPTAIAGQMPRLTQAVEKLRLQRRIEGEHGERILARLVAIERQLGLREAITVPKATRRRPLGR